MTPTSAAEPLPQNRCRSVPCRDAPQCAVPRRDVTQRNVTHDTCPVFFTFSSATHPVEPRPRAARVPSARVPSARVPSARVPSARVPSARDISIIPRGVVLSHSAPTGFAQQASPKGSLTKTQALTNGATSALLKCEIQNLMLSAVPPPSQLPIRTCDT